MFPGDLTPASFQVQHFTVLWVARVPWLCLCSSGHSEAVSSCEGEAGKQRGIVVGRNCLITAGEVDFKTALVESEELGSPVVGSDSPPFEVGESLQIMGQVTHILVGRRRQASFSSLPPCLLAYSRYFLVLVMGTRASQRPTRALPLSTVS